MNESKERKISKIIKQNKEIINQNTKTIDNLEKIVELLTQLNANKPNVLPKKPVKNWWQNNKIDF